MEYREASEAVGGAELRLPAGAEVVVVREFGEGIEHLRLTDGAVLDLRSIGSMSVQVTVGEGAREALVDVQAAVDSPSETVAVSVPQKLIEEVRTRVEIGDASLLVTRALENEVKRMELDALADHLQREHPSDPDQVAREIRAFLE